MKNILTTLPIVLLSLGLSGCLLISPYGGQILSSRTEAIPFQAWTSKPDLIRVECMPSGRFGPYVSPHGNWHEINTLPVSTLASLDLEGREMHSASKQFSLPSSCWFYNVSNRWYYTSVRVRQSENPSGNSGRFHTVNREGVSCVAESVASSGSWLSWLNDRCYNTYDDSGAAYYFVVLRTQN